MSFINVYVHFVWATKNRYPYLNSPELRTMLWKHIKENGDAKGIFIDFVGGYEDHCHCLVSMKGDQTIQQIARLIKGESSHWINMHQLTREHFVWQSEFYAIAVCETAIVSVRNYIRNQEAHHSNKRKPKKSRSYFEPIDDPPEPEQKTMQKIKINMDQSERE